MMVAQGIHLVVYQYFFIQIGRCLRKNHFRTLEIEELHIAYTYVLLNCEEIELYLEYVQSN